MDGVSRERCPFYSADEVVVVVEIIAQAIANLLETILINETAGVAGWLRNVSAVLHVSLFLHLADRGRGSILLTVVEGVVLLRDLQTEDGIADESANQDEGTHEGGHLGPLQLEMHGGAGIGQLIVQVLVDVTSRMSEVMGDIVSVHVVVMDVAATILTLRLEVEADIVPVRWPHLVVGVCRVSEVLRERKRQASGLQESHLALKVLVLTSVILLKTRLV